MKRRTIRGCGGDKVTAIVAPDPLGDSAEDFVHVTAIDGMGESAHSDGNGRNASVTVLMSMAQARRLHTALGQLLRTGRRR